MRVSAWRQRPFLPWFLLALGCAGLTAMVYGAALRLPFFFDDLVQLPFVESRSYTQLWTRAQLAYYRPLNFHLWKLFYDLFDGHSRLLNHGLNLLLHAANGWLVGWLAARLWAENGRAAWARAGLSAALFLLFPFSYQGVPWVGALNHLLAVYLMLLSLAAALQRRRTGRRRWLALGLGAALLAPFAHENGVLTAPLLALLILTDDQAHRLAVRPALRAVGLWALPGLLWLVVWRLVPAAESDGLFWNGLEGIWQSSVYFLQGVALPLSWAGRYVQARLGVPDLTAVLLLAALCLLPALWLQSRGRRAWLPWGWVGLALLPAVLFLRFDYVINGPRLMMLASVGVAWLWSDVLLQLASRRVRPRQAAAAALALALLAQNGAFIRERMRLHLMLGDAFDQGIAAAQAANAAGETAVLLNFPSWLAPEPAYAVGHEGVLFWPDYVPHGELTTVHTGAPADLVMARVEAIRPQTPYFYGVTGAPPDWDTLRQRPARVYVATYGETAVDLQLAGRLGAPPAAAAPLTTFLADGEPALQLLAAVAKTVDGGAQVTLTWQAIRPLADVTVFVHLVDGSGQLIAQADGDPLAGAYPFSVWQPGEQVTDVRTAAGAAPAGVLVGVYDRLTGVRLTAVAADGSMLPDNAQRIAAGSG